MAESLKQAITLTSGAVTPAGVLALIKQMNSRQKYGPQPIGLDTLSLALNTPLGELTPIIEELRSGREIVFHPPKIKRTNSTLAGGSVSLT